MHYMNCRIVAVMVQFDKQYSNSSTTYIHRASTCITVVVGILIRNHRVPDQSTKERTANQRTSPQHAHRVYYACILGIVKPIIHTHTHTHWRADIWEENCCNLQLVFFFLLPFLPDEAGLWLCRSSLIVYFLCDNSTRSLARLLTIACLLPSYLCCVDNVGYAGNCSTKNIQMYSMD